METILERALRFINDDYSSSSQALLDVNKANLLHINRIKLMACGVFKILNERHLYICKILLILKCPIMISEARNKVILPRVNTTRFGLRYVLYEAARVWNTLPNEIRSTENYRTARAVNFLMLILNAFFFTTFGPFVTKCAMQCDMIMCAFRVGGGSIL